MNIQDDFTEKFFWKQRLSFDSLYKMPYKVKNKSFTDCIIQ